MILSETPGHPTLNRQIGPVPLPELTQNAEMQGRNESKGPSTLDLGFETIFLEQIPLFTVKPGEKSRQNPYAP